MLGASGAAPQHHHPHYALTAGLYPQHYSWTGALGASQHYQPYAWTGARAAGTNEYIPELTPPELGDDDPITGEPYTAENIGAVEYLNPCKHCFLPEGLHPWLRTHVTCPSCRGEVDEVRRVAGDELVMAVRPNDVEGPRLRKARDFLLAPLVSGRPPALEALTDSHTGWLYRYSAEKVMQNERRRVAVLELLQEAIAVAYSPERSLHEKIEFFRRLKDEYHAVWFPHFQWDSAPYYAWHIIKLLEYEATMDERDLQEEAWGRWRDGPARESPPAWDDVPARVSPPAWDDVPARESPPAWGPRRVWRSLRDWYNNTGDWAGP